MRNIYDIIAEQKSEIDVKITGYEINYLVSHFLYNQENYYVEEGLGSALKSFGKKVVDFIKKIIEKIRQLVRNFLNFFRKNSKGPGGLEAQLNKKIEQANKEESAPAPAGGGGGGAGGGTTPEEPKTNSKPKPEPMKPGPHVKVNDLRELLEKSFLKVECKKFGPLRIRQEFIEKFSNAFGDVFEDACMEVEEKSRLPMVKVKLMEKLFYGDEDDDLIDLLHQHFYDYEDETMEFLVYRRASLIYEYIEQSYDLQSKFQRAEGEIVKRLNDMIKMIETGEVRQYEDEDENVTEEQYRLISMLCQQSSTIVSTIFNYLVQSTMRAYQICAGICVQVTNEYCRKKSHGEYDPQ